MSRAGTIRACRRIAGLQRRGVPPEAVREFVKRIGVAKANSVVDVGMLEFCDPRSLNRTALRRMAVLRPLKVVIENYPEGQSRGAGGGQPSRTIQPPARARITFGRELYIEQDDFMENPPKKFFRLSPGNEVRLRYAYFINCREVVKNAAGEVVELRCTYDPATKGGNAPDGRKVKATMHWLSAAHSKPAEIRIYNQLFAKPAPGRRRISPPISIRSRWRSCPTRGSSRRSPQPIRPRPMQFERQGYFVRDKDSDAGSAGVQPHHRPARYVCEGSRQDLSRQGLRLPAS